MVRRKITSKAAISSLAGYAGLPTSAVYSATKAGLSTFLDSIRPEAALRGVQVLDVCPGFIKTPMTDKNKHPMPMLMEVDEAAARIVRAIQSGRARYGFPFPMHAVSRLMGYLPGPVFDLVARSVARKMTSRRPRPQA